MNLTGWFTASATKQSVTARDVYGKVTWGPQSTLKCRVQPSRKIIRGTNGQEVATVAVLYTATACSVTDRFWINGANPADVNAARIPVGVDTAVDKSGNPVFFKVWF